MQDPAFVGVSLDSKLFSREWVRAAIPHILSKHRTLEFVLGDQLLAFNKYTRQNGHEDLVIDLPDAEKRITQRSGDIHHFLLSEIARLNEGERSRVSLSKWADHSDAQFAHIFRTLSVAYAALDRFRQCVDRDVEIHLFKQLESPLAPDIHRRLCALYVIEETAMIIRITEAGRPYEYYPQQHIFTLTEIYDDTFADFGLNVEGLVGHPRSRIFSPLPPVVLSLQPS